jgi:phosphoglycolate phosphatase
MMKWRAVLFDLDGTLLDTLADLADAMNRVLNRHGFPGHDYESYKYMIGNGMEILTRRSLPGQSFQEEAVAEYLRQLRVEYEAHWADQTKPYPGIEELLAFLHRYEMRLTVLSNKADDFTKQMIRHFLPKGDFEIVEGAKSGVPLKPDPTAALGIASRMNLAPADFLYLGDTGIDMRTARAAGMYPVGVLWGFRKAEELREEGAAFLLKHPAELQDFLLKQ